eukprot:jgi/Botrbrau1/17761/Bobra.0127s0018.1
MSSGRAPQSTVFVGNIPFGITDEDLKAVFQDVGPVKTLRMVADRDTGKPKGFAFIEFYDVPTAVSAQRNLNGFEFSGRKLRVDFADDQNVKGDKKDGDGPREARPSKPRVQPVGQETAQAAAQGAATMLGLPVPVPGGPGDQVTYLLGNKTRTELYEIMSQMKKLVQQNPQQAREILANNPVLTKTLFQAQIMLGMVAVPTDSAGALAGQGAQPPAPQAVPVVPPAAPPGPPPGAPQGHPPPPPAEPAPGLLRAPGGAPPSVANGSVYPNGAFLGPPPVGVPPPGVAHQQTPSFPPPTLPAPVQLPAPQPQLSQGPAHQGQTLPPQLAPPGAPQSGPPRGPFLGGQQQQGPPGLPQQYPPPGPQFPPGGSVDPRMQQGQPHTGQYPQGPSPFVKQESFNAPPVQLGPPGHQQQHQPHNFGGVPPPPPPPPAPQHLLNEGPPHLGAPPLNPQQAGPSAHNANPSVNEVLIQQVMNLSQEQINMLPPNQRDQVLKLKQWKMQQHQG